ncbi:AAA family ATPase [Nocardia farcinica]|uniref:bifunctional aminoglycoside phosphotransferase/ATP-binding protein n=1 Tax=Nocardia farcinica TaxID=37329 RepID=UPI00245768E1|nr:AAA family ATPase [Nocardia farcinica]
MLDAATGRPALITDARTAAYARLHETHTGVVVLCGDRAYKVKKPVVTDFLDFGTVELRERACRREIELNRRLAPDVYLGLAHLSDLPGAPAEPVLVMRRMPEESRLSAVLADRDGPAVDLAALATTVAHFHATARRDAGIDAAGTAERLRQRWQSLLEPLQRDAPRYLDPRTLEFVQRAALRYLAGRVRLLDERIAGGRVVDGHGDPLSEDIFMLPDGFRILDCLDFDDELRYVDGLDDAAFLAMDLEFRGFRYRAAEFLDEYTRAADDPAPASLRHHYIAYRAMIRAKTDCLRVTQGDAHAAAGARRHVDLAISHLRRGAVRLVLAGGLPGTGKSTLAARLADTTGAALLAADDVRAELRASGMITGGSGVFGAGAYEPAAKDRVYTELLERAGLLLERGVPVVLDATWSHRAHRARAAALAEQTTSEPVLLHCTCPADVAEARIAARRAGNSDATPAIAGALAASADPWPEAVPLDTTRPRQQVLAEALREYHARP